MIGVRLATRGSRLTSEGLFSALSRGVRDRDFWRAALPALFPSQHCVFGKPALCSLHLDPFFGGVLSCAHPKFWRISFYLPTLLELSIATRTEKSLFIKMFNSTKEFSATLGL